MKTTKSSVRATAKKAITLGLAAMMIVSCGKSKNEEKKNNVGTAISPVFNQFSQAQNCASPVQRIFNYNQGTLTPAAYNPTIYASYIGIDPTTGDAAAVNVGASQQLQLILKICRTGDQNIDNMLLNGIPTITQQFNFDRNVSNPAACPGRINFGNVVFGYVPSQYGIVPVQSSFQPPQECF